MWIIWEITIKSFFFPTTSCSTCPPVYFYSHLLPPIHKMVKTTHRGFLYLNCISVNCRNSSTIAETSHSKLSIENPALGPKSTIYIYICHCHPLSPFNTAVVSRRDRMVKEYRTLGKAGKDNQARKIHCIVWAPVTRIQAIVSASPFITVIVGTQTNLQSVAN